MRQENRSKSKSDPKSEEMIQILVPKRRLSRPFPLYWGIAALALFATFAVVTQLQFSRISNEKIFQARVDTYQSDLRAYDFASQANENCVTSIETRETYREIFGGVSRLFDTTAGLPVFLFPQSEEAKIYQEALKVEVARLITNPVEEKLPPKVIEDCPVVPSTEPTYPER